MPVLDHLNVRLTGGINGIAEALFMGRATDSGWFRYGNAGPEAFALAEDGIVVFVAPEQVTREQLIDACACCPVDALTVHDEHGARVVP